MNTSADQVAQQPNTKTNIRVGRGAAVHLAYGDLPRCDTGAGARGGSSRKTADAVTCKRCLRLGRA